ncbi:MAG: hypothetical protein ACM3YF_06465 [Candidatus Zixiibacteriota bacterium]
MRDKWLAVRELTLVVLIFLVQKVLKILPFSETPYLFLLGWLSLRLRREGWRSVGLARPDNWGRTMAVDLGAGIFIQLLSLYVTNSLLARLTNQPVNLYLFKPLVGNLKLWASGF